jgi:hypothetical protein
MLSVVKGRSRRLRRTLPVLVLGFLATSAPAQGLTAVQSATDVTFQLLSIAPFQTSYQMQRVRRFLDGQGKVVQVREQLTLQGDSTVDSPFKLEFLDLAGPGSAVNSTGRTQWSEVYRNHAGLLHLHGGFGVHDPVAAAQNYRLFDFGQAQRIGRPVRRVVVFPNQADKGIWVVEVDTQTGIPIYTAEYDSQLRLINELETTLFSVFGSSLARNGAPAGAKSTWNWKPRMRVSRFASLPLAATMLTGMSPIQPAIASIVPEYSQDLVQVTEDPVNGDRTLVLGYTDGIDEFFVLQNQGGGNPFQNNPSINVAGKGSAHAIASYDGDDPALRAYVFHENGITFRVVGRASLVRLKDVSFRLCQQAVTGV